MAKAPKIQQYKAFYHFLYLDFEASSLPISDRQEKRYDQRLWVGMLILYVISTLIMQLLWQDMFLGYLFHLLCFAVLLWIIYQLCPPIEIKSIQIDQEQVEIEILSATRCQHLQIPLSQYRGMVSLQIENTKLTSTSYEYGIALKHPDPKKTILLLSSKPQQHLLKSYADLLGLHALDDAKFILELKS